LKCLLSPYQGDGRLFLFTLIADAIESTTDIFASFLVLFGIKYSNRPADKTTHMDTVVQSL
jgi:hypothetical protein